MLRQALLIAICVTVLGALLVSPAMAGDKGLRGLFPQPLRTCPPQERSTGSPTCGIEITCTDAPVQLGYSDGVCFRATCPGVWALLHTRIDQASFRRRFLTYRHYHFNGTWDLKDQGVIECGPLPLRELFLVLPDDLIELKLRDPDCNAAIEVRNLGYIRKGNVEELKRWLAHNIYLERPNVDGSQRSQRRTNALSGVGFDPCALLSRILSVGRGLGLPLCP